MQQDDMSSLHTLLEEAKKLQAEVNAYPWREDLMTEHTREKFERMISQLERVVDGLETYKRIH